MVFLIQSPVFIYCVVVFFPPLANTAITGIRSEGNVLDELTQSVFSLSFIF
jgi:hypothetical protein